ncbi:MAG: SusC/RagA family TonB-linked outer membrane protein, partial [Pedobacter sp.]
MVKAPVASFAEALAGRVAGVQVNANDGQPGGGINITIRGAGSLTQSTAPLYVIDGFPVENPDPATLNTEEIESMTILKDASSTAIYGSRGANGVVVIQTKRGKIGKPVFSLNTKAGVQFTPKAMELMSPYEYVKYQQEISPSTASTTAFFAGGKTLEDYRNVEGLNFQDYILRTGQLQMHDISLRGGNDQTKYSISGSGFNQKGAIINTGFQRYSGRVTIDQNISKKFKAGITANYSNTVQSGQVVNLGAIDQNSPTAFVLARAWMYRPISYDEGDDLLEDVIDDNVITSNDLRVNPLQDMRNQDQRNKLGLLEANGYLTYTIIPSLNFKVAAGIRNNTTIQERFYNSKTSQGAPTPLNLNGINGSITNIILNGFSNEYTLNYKKNLKSGHNFTGLGLFAINGLNTSVNGYGGRLLPNEVLGLDGIDQGIGYNLISRKSSNTMVSYATRFDYNYRSKYMLTLTFRADGSSKFLNPWGYFPGAAIAWNMQKEKFFSKTFPAISTSKIRLSYGSNGNNRVGDFDRYKQLDQNIDGYSFNNGTPTNAVFVSNVGNPDLTWEKVNTLDLGYELGLFKNRVTFEFDIYRRSTSNLLLSALLPLSTGYGSAVKNIGKLRNDGLEFTLNTTNISKRNFNWQTNFNISFNRNKIIQLTRGQEGLPTNAQYVVQFNRPLYLAQIGYPAGMMIGYIWDGNYQYEDFDTPAPGVYNLKASVPSNGALR